MPSDSSAPEFWDTRFHGGVTPWDAGGVPARLESWLRTRPSGSKVLVPGCGTGYEVAAFARHGDDVLGIDFSEAAVDAAWRYLGPQSRLVRQANFFFAFAEGPFDLVYERAFLCALPRTLWPNWARRMSELVRPGGELVGFFYIDDNEHGPPFGISREGLHRLLDLAFFLRDDEPIPPPDSLAVFVGKEIWQRWERRL